jgi:hypothetical protein
MASPSAHAITGVTPRARGGGVVRIWRLPLLSGLDDGQDGRAGVRRQRVPGVDHLGIGQNTFFETVQVAVFQGNSVTMSTDVRVLDID